MRDAVVGRGLRINYDYLSFNVDRKQGTRAFVHFAIEIQPLRPGYYVMLLGVRSYVLLIYVSL